jgi:tRNA 2-thiouridine synthesizing protein A
MEHTVDARGLSCPLPLVKARAALAALPPGDELVVLATDPESPIDLAALAVDRGLRLTTHREVDHWRLVLTVEGPTPAPTGARTRPTGPGGSAT